MAFPSAPLSSRHTLKLSHRFSYRDRSLFHSNTDLRPCNCHGVIWYFQPTLSFVAGCPFVFPVYLHCPDWTLKASTYPSSIQHSHWALLLHMLKHHIHVITHLPRNLLNSIGSGLHFLGSVLFLGYATLNMAAAGRNPLYMLCFDLLWIKRNAFCWLAN